MTVVVAYDVNTETKEGRRRLRRVAQACKDYGVRVQKSVFECVMGKAEWTVLRHRLLHEFSPALDSLRFYFLDEVTKARTEHHGQGKPLDVEGTLIV